MRTIKKKITHNLRPTVLQEKERLEMLGSEYCKSISKIKVKTPIKTELHESINSTFKKLGKLKKGRFLDKTLKSVIQSTCNTLTNEKKKFNVTNDIINTINVEKSIENISERLFNLSPIQTTYVRKSIQIEDSFNSEAEEYRNPEPHLHIVTTNKSSKALKNFKIIDNSTNKLKEIPYEKQSPTIISSNPEKSIGDRKSPIICFPTIVTPLNFRNIGTLNNYLFRTHILSEVDPINEIKKKTMITENFYLKKKKDCSFDYELEKENYEQNSKLSQDSHSDKGSKKPIKKNLGDLLLDLHIKEYINCKLVMKRSNQIMMVIKLTIKTFKD
jgi:hypothetical protein